jgi:hypothetical protein
MLKPTEARAEEARKKARELFANDRAKEQAVVKEREKAFATEAAKTERLKALRLARDAADAAAAEAEPAAKPRPRARKTAKTED